MKINWDTEIPSDLIKEWNNLLKILNDLDSVDVNRNVFVNYETDPIIKHEFYGFSSESLIANLTTIYVKTILQSGKLHTYILYNHFTYCLTERNHYTVFRIVRKLDFGRFDEFCQNCYEKGCQN